jgi:hypothetical protein
VLEPEYFYGKSEKMVEMYQDLEDWILQDIASRLLKSGDLSGTADRELWKLEQMGLHRQEIIKRLSQLTGKSRNEIRRLLRDSVMTSFSSDSEVLEKVTDVVPLLQNNDVILAMDAELRKTMGELGNLTRTTMLQSQKDLLNMLNEVDFRVASGLQSYSSAVCEVLDRYAESGVMVNYPTGSRRTLEAAVRCCVVTSMNQTAAEVTNQYIIQNNVEYVVVSEHVGARYDKKNPTGISSHDWWQGKAYKIYGSEPGFPNLLESTGYDIDFTAKRGVCVNMLGLHGYNCRHSHGPWYKELGTSRQTVNKEESQKRYDLEQQQRATERAIRKTKRQLIVKEQEMKGFPDDEKIRADYDKLSYRLRMQNQKYNEFCTENDLQKQYDRTKVAGFKRAQTAKANGRATAYKNQNKTQSKGLSANDDNWKIPEHPEPVLEGRIDISDATAVENVLNRFEKDTVNEKIENACVITKSGEIYRCYGTENSVFPDADLKDKLIGATVSHNHPADYTEFSFSKADFELFNDYQLEVLRGADVKYKYEFNRNKDNIDKHKSIFDLTEEDTAHEESITRAERAQIGYRRWLNE